MYKKISTSLIIVLCIGLTVGVLAIANEEPTKDPVKIGVAVPLTGTYGWLGISKAGMQLAADEINDAGGILGHPLKLPVADTETSSTGAVSAVKKLVGQGIIGLTGPGSSTVRSVMPILKENDIVGIFHMPGTMALDDKGGEYFFRTISSDTAAMAGQVKKAQELEAETAALFYSNKEGAQSVKSVVELGCEVVGIEIIGETTYVPGQASYRSELMKTLQGNPDVVFFEAGPKDGGVIFKQWKSTGVAPDATWIGTDFVNEALLDASWPYSEGTIGVSSGAALTDRYKEFKKKLPEYRSGGVEGVPTFSAMGYDAINIYALAFQAVGEVEKEAIKGHVRDVANPPGVKVTNFKEGKEALQEGKEINYEGLMGAQDFDENGNVVTTMQVMKFTNPDERERIGTFYADDLRPIFEEIRRLREERGEG